MTFSCRSTSRVQLQMVAPRQLAGCCREAAVTQGLDPKVVTVYQAVGKIMSR